MSETEQMDESAAGSGNDEAVHATKNGSELDAAGQTADTSFPAGASADEVTDGPVEEVEEVKKEAGETSGQTGDTSFPAGASADEVTDGPVDEAEEVKQEAGEISDLQTNLGSCVDCLKSAKKKMRRFDGGQALDLVLCENCCKLHKELQIDGEISVDVQQEVNDELESSRKKSSPLETPYMKRAEWECKIRPYFTPQEAQSYITEKYKKNTFEDNFSKEGELHGTEEEAAEFEFENVLGLPNLSGKGIFIVVFKGELGVKIKSASDSGKEIFVNATSIRYVSLAYNGDETSFVELSVKIADMKIRNGFFVVHNYTQLFKLINAARRMLYIYRGRSEDVLFMLNNLEPLNRLCEVNCKKITADEKTELYTKKFLVSVDVEFLWMKETIDGDDEPVVLAFYAEAMTGCVDEIKLQNRKNVLTIRIKVYDGDIYLLTALKKNDKSFHFLKANLLRTPIKKVDFERPEAFKTTVAEFQKWLQKPPGNYAERMKQLKKESAEISFDDIPDLQPEEEGFRDDWENLRTVLKENHSSISRTPPDDRVQGGDPQSHDLFGDYVEQIQTAYLTQQYLEALQRACYMMEIFKTSKLEEFKRAAESRKLLQFVYNIIFKTKPN